MNPDDFALAVCKRLLVDEVREEYTLPSANLIAYLAAMEIEHPAEKLQFYEEIRQECDGRLNDGYKRDEIRCRAMMRFARIAHALGFIDDTHYQRFITPYHPEAGKNFRALRDLVYRTFPHPAATLSDGTKVYWIPDDDGKWVNPIHLTYDNGKWYRFAGNPYKA